VADESLFTSWTPTSTNENDGAPGIATALKFSSAVAGVVKGVRFYRTTTDGGIYTVRLWLVTAGEEDPGPGAGTELANKTFGGTATTGWNDVLFDTPVSIAADTLYAVERHNTQGRYVAEGGGLAFSVTVGNLTAWGANQSGDWPALGTVRNGTYRFAAAGNYPNQFSGAPNYGVDVIFEEAVDPAEGSAALGLDLALATSGARDSGAVAAAGLVLTLAAAGDAPAIPPSEGEAGLALVYSLGANGITPPPGESNGSADLGLVLTLATTGDAPEPGEASGSAALGLALTLATTGEAPVLPDSGNADFELAYAITANGITPEPGQANGAAAFTLNLALAGAGSNGTPAFPCRPVRSFSEVVPV
jgi:hypothetical protein